MEDGPWDVRAFKELFRHVQRLLDVPGDEVHIAAVAAGGPAGESEHFRSFISGKHFFQLVSEVEDLLTAFLLPQGIQRIAEEARHRAIGMEIVHKIIVGIQIAVDERHTASGAHHGIQPPIGVGIFIGFHFVAKVALQIGFRVGGEFQPPLLQSVGKLRQEEGRLCLGFLQHIKAIYVSHVGDLAQHLVGEGGEHPPGPTFLLPEHRQQLFTVGGDGKAVFALLLQPDLHILPGDIPAIVGAQSDVSDGLTAHKDVPVLQHLLGGMLLEVDQLKQFDLITLRGEDQLVLLAVKSHFKGDFIKDQIQGFLHLGHEFGTAGVIFVLIHHLAQFCFHFRKGFPPVLCPLPEALRELRQGNALLAPVNQFLNVLLGVELRIITGMQFQSFFKIPKSPAFLIQIIIGISHAEIPGISVSKFLLLGLHQFQCPVKQLSSLRLAGVRQIVVGPGQFHIDFRGTLFGRNSLQRVNDLLVFVVFMPLLALLQNIHIRLLLILFRFPALNLLKHTTLVPLKSAGGGRMQQRNDVGIVVADRIQLVNPGIVGIIHVRLALVTSGKAPAAVPAAVRLLPVAVAHLAALYCDAVGGDTAIGALPVGQQMFHIFRLYMVVPITAGGFVQLFPQHLHLISHICDLILAHHLADVVFQRGMDKVRQGLIHGVVLLRRNRDADTAGGGVVLVQILKVYTATDAALQQDGGQVGDHINGEVEVHLHAIGMCKLQVLHGLAKVPVLLVQTDLGENLAEGDLLLFLIL